MLVVTVELDDVTEPKLAMQAARRQALKALAREWRAQGHTFEAIAEATNRSLRTVWLWCHDVPKGQVG